MNWIPLQNEGQLEKLKEQSNTRPQVIFKHSTRCSISAVAKSRLEKVQPPVNIDFYFLDLLSFRHISSKIADEFGIEHESPQILVIRNGECVYNESHMGISMKDIMGQVVRD